MTTIPALLRNTTLVGLLFASGWIATPARAQHPPDPHGSVAAAESAPADADDEGYNAALASERRKYFASAMSGLTAPQLEVFWSVYADYEREKTALVDARVKLIRSYVESFASTSGLSDAEVTRDVQDMAKLQRQLIDLRLKYFEIYARKIDAKAAGRFALIEDYVTATVRLEWLKQIPFPGDERPR